MTHGDDTLPGRSSARQAGKDRVAPSRSVKAIQLAGSYYFAQEKVHGRVLGSHIPSVPARGLGDNHAPLARGRHDLLDSAISRRGEAHSYLPSRSPADQPVLLSTRTSGYCAGPADSLWIS